MSHLYADIHDKLRTEGYIVNFYDIVRIIELYNEMTEVNE
jgi:hypothetical protein